VIARLAERTPLDRLELQRLRKRKLWLKDQIVKIETGLDEGITQAVISPLLISVLTNSNLARKRAEARAAKGVRRSCLVLPRV